MYRQGTLVRRWVPVRTSGGVATVCDLMTGTTITPSGDGAFIAGPDFADFDVYVVDQAWDGEPRHAPKPFVAATNRTTGVALEPGRDYTVTYTNNAAGANAWFDAVNCATKFADAASVSLRHGRFNFTGVSPTTGGLAVTNGWARFQTGSMTNAQTVTVSAV